jgi:hypothetical protein
LAAATAAAATTDGSSATATTYDYIRNGCNTGRNKPFVKSRLTSTDVLVNHNTSISILLDFNV